MKKNMWLFLSLIIGLTSTLQSLTPMSGLGMPPGQGGLLPMPSEAEMKEINEFLSTLSEAEREELAKIGEEIIKAAEKEGVDVFYQAKPTPAPPAPPRPAPAPKPIPAAEKTKPAPKSASQEARRLLIQLIKLIDTVRQKASSDNILEDKLTPLDFKLNSFLYYLHVLNDEKIAGYLKDKEFENCYNMLHTLTSELDRLNNLFEVPEFLISQKAPPKELMVRAEKTLDRIITLLQKSLFQENINGELEKVLKKYEPEALKIKKELDAKEKLAHDAAKQLPVIKDSSAPIPGRYAPPRPSFGHPGMPGPVPHNHHASSLYPTGPGKVSAIQPKQDAKKQPAAPPKKEPEKKPSNPKASLQDMEQGISSQIQKIDSALQPAHSQVSSFLSGYAADKKESDAVSSALGEANFGLKKLKATVKKWYETVDQEAKNSKEFKQKTKKMSDLYNSHKHSTLKEIHSNIKDLTKDKVLLEGSVKRFKEMMDDIEKKLTATI